MHSCILNFIESMLNLFFSENAVRDRDEKIKISKGLTRLKTDLKTDLIQRIDFSSKLFDEN